MLRNNGYSFIYIRRMFGMAFERFFLRNKRADIAFSLILVPI